MKTLDLNAASWTTALDFYEALLSALGAPRFHGRNINALIDSMIYGGINEIDPPYEIRVVGIERASKEARDELVFSILALGEAQGDDDSVRFRVTP